MSYIPCIKVFYFTHFLFGVCWDALGSPNEMLLCTCAGFHWNVSFRFDDTKSYIQKYEICTLVLLNRSPTFRVWSGKH